MRRNTLMHWSLIVPLLLLLGGCMKGDADLRKGVARRTLQPVMARTAGWRQLCRQYECG